MYLRLFKGEKCLKNKSIKTVMILLHLKNIFFFSNLQLNVNNVW
jgi:hypothetical protein